MRTITINTKDGPIELLDDEEQTIEETVKFLLDMMRANTLALIHTVNTSTLLRPSSISGIVVKDNIELPPKEETLPLEDIQPDEITDKKSEQNVETVEEAVDIITDKE
jgi:hypothetical protein